MKIYHNSPENVFLEKLQAYISQYGRFICPSIILILLLGFNGQDR